MMPGKNGSAHVADQERVAQVAAHYITATFGPAFSIHALYQKGETWWVRVQCQQPQSEQPLVVGSIEVDSLSGQVVPLALAAIEEIQARATMLVANRQQELARDTQGYILPTQAKVKVTGYVADHIAFFATADEQPQWVDGTPPVWRVSTALWLRGQGKVCDLGFVDVNALTGDIVALSEQEITIRQKRARHAATPLSRRNEWRIGYLSSEQGVRSSNP